MYVNVVFVVRRLYSGVSFTLVIEKRFIRITMMMMMMMMMYAKHAPKRQDFAPALLTTKQRCNHFDGYPKHADSVAYD